LESEVTIARIDSSKFDVVASSRAGRSDCGYALVALLALMTVIAIVALTAVPNILQQAQREREQECIFRGEQVAEAIRLYIQKSPNHQPPTSIDQLLEGVPQGSKKLKVLRPSASLDPLSADGKWKLIKPNGAAMIEFQRALMTYAGRPVDPNPRKDQFLAQFAQLAQMGSIVDTGTTSIPSKEDDLDENYTGPFIGVASHNKRSSVIVYYGIEQHDEWIFTPLFR
jgi:type II secretory pathway pseudopilin PulG